MTHWNLTPVLPGFWSDPTVCRTPDGFALAHSCFQCSPAAPLHHSDDRFSYTATVSA